MTHDAGVPRLPEDEREHVRELVVEAIASDRTPEEVSRERPDLIPLVRERLTRARAIAARVDAVFPSTPGRFDTGVLAAVAALPQVPGYDVDSVLGRGGMGVAYRAHRRADGDLFALKLVHPHLLHVPGFRGRFQREAQIGRRIVHENVVRTLEVGAFVEDGVERPFLVMEYVEGQTLRALIAEVTRVPEELCRHVGREIAKGLAAIHAGGAVHRDVKPDNVLVTRDHVVKVMDLGVAKVEIASDDLSAASAFVGSVRYAAPEQLLRDGPTIDARADLHALGVVLYEMATGRHPFEADDVAAVVRAIAEEAPRRAGLVNPQVSPFFEEVVACLLEKRREARFASAQQVAAVLEQGEQSTWWSDRARAIRSATQRPLRKVRVPRESALHGRGDDVARLSALFSRARSGEGQVALVEGEAGIGKSRLIDEFTSLLRDSGQEFDVLVGGYSPGGAATATGALVAAFRDHFGEDDLEGVLSQHLGGAAALAPAFAALLRGETPPAGQAPLTKDALQTAFIRTTQSLARRRPVLVLVEDLHLAPDEGLALFAAVALAVAGDRVLLLGTARRSLDAAWSAQIGGLPHASRLALSRLARDDVEALLVDALGAAGIAEQLAPQFFDKTDGNPYFVFEILRDLRECKLLARMPDGSWGAANLIDHLRSPSSIRDLIQARVAKLSAEDREILHVAACYGFEFDPLLVGDVLQLPRLALLRRLCDLEVGHRLVHSAGRSYVFDHHQVQEVIHESLSQVHRKHYHGAIATALEEATGAAAGRAEELPGPLCAELTHHLFQASQPERALRYFDAAREHLRRVGRIGAANRLTAAALAVPGLLSGRQRVAALLACAGSISFLGGDAGEELRLLDEATALGETIGDPVLLARTLTARGDCRWRTLRNDDARDEVTRALALFGEAGDRDGEAVTAVLLGKLSHHFGRADEARVHCERALALAQEGGARKTEAAALGALAIIAYHASRLEESRAYGERALHITRELRDVPLETAATGRLGDTLVCLGRYEEARALHERGVELARSCGSRRNEAAALAGVALDCHGLGLYDEALTKMRRSLDVMRETSDRRNEALNLANFGAILICVGRAEEAIAATMRSLELSAEIQLRFGEPVALLVRGVALGELGRAADAGSTFERAATVSRSLAYAEGTAGALMSLATIRADQGAVADGIRLFDEALELGRASRLRNVLVVASAERVRVAGSGAEEALSLLTEHGASLHVHDRARARIRLFEATGDETHIEEASAILDFVVDHAPADCRASIVENVRVHREIAAARRLA